MIKKLIRRLVPACILAGGLLFGVMVLLARADTPIVDLSAGEEDFRVVGESALDWMGEMTTGDINADGIPDLIVGASGYDITGTIPITDAGAVYVIFGSVDLSQTLNLGDFGQNADIVFYGWLENSSAGHVVASGDLNGDGYADIVIGADNFYNSVGAVYAVYGPITETLTSSIYLSDTEQVDLTIYGQDSGDHFGRAVAVGDVNGDGIDDLIGGAYLADRPGGADSGRTYVFYGSETLSGTIRLDQPPWDADVIITGTNGSRLGRSLATGDVDGNGVDDLIIGAPFQAIAGPEGPGDVVLVYGSVNLSSTIDLQIDNITGQGLGLRVQGVNDNDAFGFFVGSGNINGDRNPTTPTIGYDDVLVGAYLGSGRGIGYILYGGSEITTGMTITSGTWTVPISDFVNAAIFNAADPGDRLGRSVSSGDVNADGYDDFVIGASHADPDGRSNAGEAYVFYGGTHLSGTITISPTGNTDLTVLGHRANDEAGRSTAVGDLNGDGVPDLIVGSVMANTGTGEVYVIWGPAATAISMTASTDVITVGQSVTFTVTASNDYSQTWDVTGYSTAYTTSFAAGGAWNQNHYTAEIAGTWMMTAAHRGLTATTVITVVPNTASITRSVVATGTISFAPLPVTIVVEDRGPDNCLTEISVTQFEQNHPHATTDNLRTGRYWAITQKDCGSGDVFTATLNLPLGSLSQEDSPKLCRWADEGWDCAEDEDHIVGTDSITRTNIHAFSLWTVGYKVSPTALTVSGLTARGASWGAMFGSLLVLVAVALHLPRKRRRR